jgi:hypothetical protein
LKSQSYWLILKVGYITSVWSQIKSWMMW